MEQNCLSECSQVRESCEIIRGVVLAKASLNSLLEGFDKGTLMEMESREAARTDSWQAASCVGRINLFKTMVYFICFGLKNTTIRPDMSNYKEAAKI